ncbi:SDR family NAD(P)-dependent oxidoreductase [Candidatus Marinimicrobia bacterium]|nr:SDR family NAD(P)-dependent oxidoreductase [Candidatus Neomarinimicrobiota bacterium]
MQKKIFIMGASTGIGKALAINYANEEVVLGLASRRIDLLKIIKEECKSLKCKIFIYKTDVRKKSECEQSAKSFIEVAGGIDILIANSGVGSSDEIFSGSSEKINRVLETNILGVTNIILPFLPRMKEQKSGSIVVVSSVASFIPIPHKGGYSASKVAVRRLFDSWRPILVENGIKAISICPGFIDTPMTEKILFKPFLRDTNTASKAFIKAIEVGKKTYIYPWQMKLFVKAFNILPQFFYDWVINKSKSSISKYDKN